MKDIFYVRRKEVFSCLKSEKKFQNWKSWCRSEGGNSMAKMGRPKSDDPMNYRFTIRFSNAEQKQLEAYAEKYDLTKGQVLKKGLELLYRQDKHS